MARVGMLKGCLVVALTLLAPGAFAGGPRRSCEMSRVFIGGLGEGPDVEQFIFFLENQLRKRGFEVVGSVEAADMVFAGTVNTKERTSTTIRAAVSGEAIDSETSYVGKVADWKEIVDEELRETGVDAELESDTETRTVAKITMVVFDAEGNELGRYFSKPRGRERRNTVRSTAKDAARYLARACRKGWLRSGTFESAGAGLP